MNRFEAVRKFARRIVDRFDLMPPIDVSNIFSEMDIQIVYKENMGDSTVRMLNKAFNCRTTAKEKKPSYSSLSIRLFETAAQFSEPPFLFGYSVTPRRPIGVCLRVCLYASIERETRSDYLSERTFWWRSLSERIEVLIAWRSRSYFFAP